jgi:hypothetical protein
MTEEFNTWCDNDLLTQTNPYLDGTPVYWAWEGWQAGIRAERERIFQELLRMHENTKGTHNYFLHAVGTIRARGEAK